MNKELERKLKFLQKDYQKKTGTSFKNFFCPFLYEDEKVEICKGHLINQAFPNVSRRWTIQRKDIDSFFGSVFESEFIFIKDYEKFGAFEALQEKHFNPTISLSNKSVDYFHYNGNNHENFIPIIIDKNGITEKIILKKPSSDIELLKNEKFEVEQTIDLTIPTIVSLLKMAHLTMFYIFGYSYIFTKGGYYVGNQILGQFFKRNKGKSKKEVQIEAEKCFLKFLCLTWSLISDFGEIIGTIESKKILCCQDLYEKSPWAFIVFIRIDNQIHAVLLPYIDNSKKLAKFENFIHKPRKILIVRNAIVKNGFWLISKNPEELRWRV